MVVTARQRAESIEDVPATVQAFTDAEIASAGIERPQDFIALTPGVAQVQTAEAGDMQVVIRGINTGRDAETNFALVVDGVLQTNPNALNQELSERLADRSAEGTAGRALRPQCARRRDHPDDAQAGRRSLRSRSARAIGSDDSYKGDLYLSGPLGDTRAGSLSAYTRSTDGQFGTTPCSTATTASITSRSTGAIGPADLRCRQRQHRRQGQGTRRSSPARSTSTPRSRSSRRRRSSARRRSTRIRTTTTSSTPTTSSRENEQENLNFSIKGDWDVGVGTLTAVLAYNDQTNFFLTDGASDAFFLYALTPSCAESFAARLGDTPLPAPFNYGNPPGTIVSFTPYASSFQPPYGPTTCGGYQYQQRDQEDMSLELRLTSPGDQRAALARGRVLRGHRAPRRGLAGLRPDRRFAASRISWRRLSCRPAARIPTDLLYDDTFDSKVYAGFGQIAYDIVDDVELALARALRLREARGRQQRADRADRFARADAAVRRDLRADAVHQSRVHGEPGVRDRRHPEPLADLRSVPAEAVDQLEGDGRRRALRVLRLRLPQRRLQLLGQRRRPSTCSTAGCASARARPSTPALGFDVPLGLPACTAGSTRNLTDVNDDYRKEVSKAAEIGFKSTLLDRTLAINGAIYHTDVEDMQFFNFFAGPFGLLRVVTNLDEVTIQGAELDFNWRAND